MKILLFIVSFIIIYILLFLFLTTQNIKKIDKKNDNSKCSIHSCEGLDPLMEPAYNMQQIVKQSILLEEHLLNKNKRCRDCITKHFLHIIGLAEEAKSLGTKNFKDYPLLDESIVIYNNLFKLWHSLHHNIDEKVILHICDQLRTNRKKLVAIYFFDDKYDLKSKIKE